MVDQSTPVAITCCSKAGMFSPLLYAVQDHAMQALTKFELSESLTFSRLHKLLWLIWKYTRLQETKDQSLASETEKQSLFV